MEFKQKKNSVPAKITKFVMAFAMIFVVFFIPYSHISFQKRVVAVMDPAAAENLSLLSPGSASSPWGPRRVWIAKSRGGYFEYRSAYPIIGQVPFDPFGSGVTAVNLLAECQRLGETACNIIENI